MTQILPYLQSEYKKNPFPFFTKIELINMFGASAKEELNELKQNGSIRKRKGINGDLVELLIFKNIK